MGGKEMKHYLLSTDFSYKLQPLMSPSRVHSVQKFLHRSSCFQENAESVHPWPFQEVHFVS